MTQLYEMPSHPNAIGCVHFVGIGGIGMSGIAEIMHNLGYHVQGSDVSENANVQRLQNMGIKIFKGHDASNMADVALLVISSAIKTDENPEVLAARKISIPVIRRSEMLAELMRLKYCLTVAGTHGKTTTTSMVAAVLDGASLDPTVINGGVINAYGTNARLGSGDWVVVEADESDGTFVRLPSTIGIVTNIDPEHLDYYGSFDGLRDAFARYVENIPFYGAALMCIDSQEVQNLMGRISDRRITTYGLSPQADIRADNISVEGQKTLFDVVISDRRLNQVREIQGFSLPMLGQHNLQNALAAIAAGLQLGVTDEAIKQALSEFGGVKRRFTLTGEWQGVEVYDDYAHHPVEINAVLESARAAATGKGGRVTAVVQPHRYTRLRDLFEDFCTAFNDADSVIVAPVFPAGEAPIEGVNSEAMVTNMIAKGHRDVRLLDSPENLSSFIADMTSDGDVVICMGAGSITQWANDLPAQLAELKEASK